MKNGRCFDGSIEVVLIILLSLSSPIIVMEYLYIIIKYVRKKEKIDNNKKI